MSISKNQVKWLNSLQIKKNRSKDNSFIAEGIKTVDEFLKAQLGLVQLFCVDDILEKYNEYNPVVISESDLKKVSSLKNPNKVLAVFKMPKSSVSNSLGLKVVLDEINDPGNLGTIIRLCDWFGVEELLCSKNTVDCFNSKVVQSTMGSLSRVSIQYLDIETYINDTDLPVFIADMDGENIYQTDLPKDGVIVMGNEANGVSDNIRKIVEHKLSIPRFGNLQVTESLNVATATSIILSEFRRSTEM